MWKFRTTRSRKPQPISIEPAVSIEAAVRKLLQQHTLDRIALIVMDSSVMAHAFPAQHNQIIPKRRAIMLRNARRGGFVNATRATKINVDAAASPLAAASATSIEAVLAALATEIVAAVAKIEAEYAEMVV